MVVEYIRYQIPEDRREAFVGAYAQAAREGLDVSPYCLFYELSECADEPGAYILRIEWDSAEGHLQGFRKSAEFAPFVRAIGAYVPNIQEMRHYNVTSVVGQGR